MKTLNRVATAVSGGIGAYTLISLIWTYIAHGSVMLEARPEPVPADPGVIVGIFIWSTASALAAYTKFWGR